MAAFVSGRHLRVTGGAGLINCGASEGAFASPTLPNRRMNAQRFEALRGMGIKPSLPLCLIEVAFVSLSSLHHERSSALTCFLKRHFEAIKFLRTQFREHSFHLPGMLSKG
jgi:hypothetical protein